MTHEKPMNSFVFLTIFFLVCVIRENGAAQHAPRIKPTKKTKNAVQFQLSIVFFYHIWCNFLFVWLVNYNLIF